jgi:hypothetical protein
LKPLLPNEPPIPAAGVTKPASGGLTVDLFQWRIATRKELKRK